MNIHTVKRTENCLEDWRKA